MTLVRRDVDKYQLFMETTFVFLSLLIFDEFLMKKQIPVNTFVSP